MNKNYVWRRWEYLNPSTECLWIYFRLVSLFYLTGVNSSRYIAGAQEGVIGDALRPSGIESVQSVGVRIVTGFGREELHFGDL